MIALDVEYFERRSILLDIGILVMTVPAVLSGRGAG
jgi:lipopolysaccharide/colanic/teichoic acid biosynthesis glycosyltransferase